MSSLLQFQGKIDRRGVHLRAIRVYIPAEWSTEYPDRIYTTASCGREAEYYVKPCPVCGKHHEVLYTFVRKPAGMLGCWVVFRYNGGEHIPDLSCPISTTKMPRDAKMMTVEEAAAAYFHAS